MCPPHVQVLKKAGLDGKDTVFLFTDSQIVQESFLEDINNILNAGEVRPLQGSMISLTAASPQLPAASHFAASQQPTHTSTKPT